MSLIAVGSYTDHPSPRIDARGAGITVLERDDSSGGLTVIGSDSSVRNPTYLSWDAERRYLYAVSEVDDGDGAIAVFSIDEGGKIRYLSSRPSGAGSGCHLQVFPDEEVLVAVSYHKGGMAHFPLTEGLPGPPRYVHSYRGNGPNTERQSRAHAHQVMRGPAGRHYYVCDLGSDCVWMHDADHMDRHPDSALDVPPGYGPRHLAFDPLVPAAYILCELVPRILCVSVSADTGRMRILREFDSSPPGAPSGPAQAPAAVKIHPSGSTLAVSNRFVDTVAVFAVKRDNDEPIPALALIEHFSCGGRVPRDIEFSRDGSQLFIANQESHTVSIRRFDEQTGYPAAFRDESIPTGSPVCIMSL